MDRLAVPPYLGGRRGVGNKPFGKDIDRSFPFTDYYFLEAIVRCRRPVHVAIDAMPGSESNRVFPNCCAFIPLAVLGAPDFDATRLDPASVTVSGVPVRRSPDGSVFADITDVNSDGPLDLLVEVPGDAFDFTRSMVRLTMRGRCMAREFIEGEDILYVRPRSRPRRRVDPVYRHPLGDRQP